MEFSDGFFVGILRVYIMCSAIDMDFEQYLLRHNIWHLSTRNAKLFS